MGVNNQIKKNLINGSLECIPWATTLLPLPGGSRRGNRRMGKVSQIWGGMSLDMFPPIFNISDLSYSQLPPCSKGWMSSLWTKKVADPGWSSPSYCLSPTPSFQSVGANCRASLFWLLCMWHRKPIGPVGRPCHWFLRQTLPQEPGLEAESLV